jgi:AraC-like DNA-binding protein
MTVLFPGVSDSIHIRLFAAGHIRLKRWWTETDRIRSMWRLCRTDEEGAALRFGTKTYWFPPGRFSLVPPGLRFETHLERSVNKFYVLFEVIGWTARSVRDLFPEPITLPANDFRDQLADELQKEVAISERLGPALASRVKSLVHLTMASLEDVLPDEKIGQLYRLIDYQSDILEVVRFIESHIDESLDNALLAEIAHSSESCFIRRFREAMGQTPARYVQDRRVARAAELLVCTNQSIDEVAQRCGFANRYYFSRVFSEHIGLPPVRYRNERPQWTQKRQQLG